MIAIEKEMKQVDWIRGLNMAEELLQQAENKESSDLIGKYLKIRISSAVPLLVIK